MLALKCDGTILFKKKGEDEGDWDPYCLKSAVYRSYDTADIFVCEFQVAEGVRITERYELRFEYVGACDPICQYKCFYTKSGQPAVATGNIEIEYKRFRDKSVFMIGTWPEDSNSYNFVLEAGGDGEKVEV